MCCLRSPTTATQDWRSQTQLLNAPHTTQNSQSPTHHPRRASENTPKLPRHLRPQCSTRPQERALHKRRPHDTRHKPRFASPSVSSLDEHQVRSEKRNAASPNIITNEHTSTDTLTGHEKPAKFDERMHQEQCRQSWSAGTRTQRACRMPRKNASPNKKTMLKASGKNAYDVVRVELAHHDAATMHNAMSESSLKSVRRVRRGEMRKTALTNSITGFVRVSVSSKRRVDG
jgi:hypothetical protein